MIENEVKKKTFQRGVAEIHVKNGSIIDNLANHRNSLGQRRKRIHIEEAALLNNELFDEVMKPIVEVPRYTCGKLAIVNPEELNQQIHFFSTPGKILPHYIVIYIENFVNQQSWVSVRRLVVAGNGN